MAVFFATPASLASRGLVTRTPCASSRVQTSSSFRWRCRALAALGVSVRCRRRNMSARSTLVPAAFASKRPVAVGTQHQGFLPRRDRVGVVGVGVENAGFAAHLPVVKLK
jgi:hypothetical protein